MKRVLLAILAVLISVSSFADAGDRHGRDDRRDRRDDRRDDRWGHRPPHHRPPHGGYHPGPGPRPYPYPYLRENYITCASEKGRPELCSTRLRVVERIDVYIQHSRSPCIGGITYQVRGNSVLVHSGCRATFRVIGR